MNFMFIFLIILAVLLVFGLVIDIVAKRKGKKVDLKRGERKSKSTTGDMYATSLHQDRNNNLL